MGHSPFRFPSPLRYPGGKGKLANFIRLLVLENGLVGRRYVEPFAGGASVGLNLLFGSYASHIHINDLNPGVHAFWRAALDETDELCRRVREVPLTMEEWHRQKAVQKDREAASIDLGFSTFYLNRTSRSGIIRGGVIGGQRQDGKWSLGARFNREDLVARIRKVGRYRTRIHLTRIDAASFLREQLPLIDEPFVYLDPPYYEKGEGLYDNFYVHDDHEVIAGLVAEMRCPWIVSYDAREEIAAMYEGWPRIDYGLSYSAGDRYRGSEFMFISPLLDIPAGMTPGAVPAEAVTEARLRALDRADEASRH